MASSQSNLSVNLEGKFVGFHGGEAVVLRGDAGRGSSVVASGGLVVIAAGQEFDVFGGDFQRNAGGAVVGLIGSGTHGTNDANLAALSQKLGAVLAQLTPRSHAEEILRVGIKMLKFIRPTIITFGLTYRKS